MMPSTRDNNNQSDLLEDINKAAKQTEEMLNLRRKLELKLIQKHDRPEIDKFKECWYLIDSMWLNGWSAFVHSDGDPPGIISSKGLIDKDKKPLPGLRNRIDYRGVTPLVFYMLVDLYGHDNTPQFTRYTIDIYDRPVPIERLVDIQYRAQIDAGQRVHRIRSRWIKWDPGSSDDDKEKEDYYCWCCGLSKEHLEAFIYWMIMCWSRKKSGRSKIRYRSYQPLKNEESAHGDDLDAAIDDVEHFQIAPADKDHHSRKSWLWSFVGRS